MEKAKRMLKGVLIGFGVLFILFIIIGLTGSFNEEQKKEVAQTEKIYYMIDSEEGFIDNSKRKVNLFKSYEDKTKVGTVYRFLEVTLLGKDEKNNYCKIDDGGEIGWLSCDWLREYKKIETQTLLYEFFYLCFKM